LMDERALGSLLDLQPEEELQHTHHTHLELPRHLLRKLGDKSVRRDTKDDEHMAGQINSGSNSLDANIDSIISSSNNLKAHSFIKFGAFSGGCEANVEGRKCRQYGYFTSQDNI